MFLERVGSWKIYWKADFYNLLTHDAKFGSYSLVCSLAEFKVMFVKLNLKTSNEV